MTTWNLWGVISDAMPGAGGEPMQLNWHKKGLPFLDTMAVAVFEAMMERESCWAVEHSFAASLYYGCLRRDVQFHGLFNDTSVRFLARFASDPAHACFLIDHDVGGFLEQALSDSDGNGVLASIWELLLALVTHSCPAHLCELLLHPMIRNARKMVTDKSYTSKNMAAFRHDGEEITAWAVKPHADFMEQQMALMEKNQKRIAKTIHKRFAKVAGPFCSVIENYPKDIFFTLGFELSGLECNCLECTLKHLGEVQRTIDSEKASKELLALEELEKKDKKNVQTQKKKKKKAKAQPKKKPAWMDVDELPETLSPPMDPPPPPSSPPPPPPPLPLIPDDPEELQAMVDEQEKLFAELEQRKKPCDYCLDATHQHLLVACKECGSTSVCRACIQSLSNIGAQCSRCRSDL